MDFPVEIVKNGKTLRCGYTTGSCAAAAASAAARMLLSEEAVCSVRVETPAGIALQLEVEDVSRSDGAVSCAVRKFSGDDPDITDGILICARVEKTAQGIRIDGGTGVGRVTCPGLDQPVGEAAINSTPRRMIRQHLERIGREFGYSGGFSVEISIPEGETLAKKTFNGKLGIVGGLSVLGTTGIVEPMSEAALVETIRVELRQRRAMGKEYALLTPGNYGSDFIRQNLDVDLNTAVQVSNFLGDALDICRALGFRGALLVGHVGKLVKTAGGMMNTHSKYGDCRMEILAAHAAAAGVDAKHIREILDCAACDDAVRILRECGRDAPALARVTERALFHLSHRADGMEVGLLMFSKEYGVLGQSENAPALLKKIMEE